MTTETEQTGTCCFQLGCAFVVGAVMAAAILGAVLPHYYLPSEPQYVADGKCDACGSPAPYEVVEKGADGTEKTLNEYCYWHSVVRCFHLEIDPDPTEVIAGWLGIWFAAALVCTPIAALLWALWGWVDKWARK